MRAAIEYLLVALVLMTMIASVSGQILANTEKRQSILDQQQLVAVAEKTLDQMLLNPGQPANWGLLTTTNVLNYGLALDKGKPYELDFDKILRSVGTTYVYSSDILAVPSDVILSDLGLKGKYDFSISFVPLLNITINWTHSNTLLRDAFVVTVRNAEMVAVPNANVTGFYLVAYVVGGAGQPNFSVYEKFFKYGNTSVDGKCAMSFIPEAQSLMSNNPIGALFMVSVDLYGMKTTFSIDATAGEQSAYGTIIGDTLYISSCEGFPDLVGEGGGAIPKMGPWVYLIEGEGSFDKIGVSGKVLPINPNPGSARPVWKFVSSAFQGDVMMAVFTVFRQGRWHLVIAPRTPERVTLGHNPGERGGASTVSIGRYVTVDGLQYVVSMVFWRAYE